MPDVPNQFFNAAIKSQIDLERYAEDVRLKVIGRLNDAQKEIITAIAQADSAGNLTPWKQERYRVLMDQIDGILKDSYSAIDGNVKKALVGISTYEQEKSVAEAKKIVGFNMFDVQLTEKNLESIVSKTLIDGHIVGSWWEKQAADTQFKLSQQFNEAAKQIQTGMIKGEAIGELVKRVRGTKDTPGVMSVSRREATALVRTSVMQVAHDTRLAMYDANADIIKGFQVVATLDNRTTPLCRALDGKQYDLDRKPIDHDTPLPEGPPFHWNCRSTLIPIVKAYSELKKGKGGISKAKLDAIDALDVGTRTSFGAINKGYVDAGLDYNAWLKTQPEEYQIEVLGPGRWNLWRDDKLTMADMIDQSGRPLSLKELNEKLAQISEIKAARYSLRG
jgi:SPP1 gp7 family putative phage head morphogenesis protein